ncbi:hypothetical protein FN846DRAFT_361837 [Sphaerosporella brunnea]|uniref:Uncharacterized protein n=1 Tax=Sphaerosporella brunnea TaxID=1250544 RepID=A0A5J5EJ43_9PEZI|nr:hypothetical protein FN846DRAFT_361837 [Sphaerosporella brunnea]
MASSSSSITTRPRGTLHMATLGSIAVGWPGMLAASLAPSVAGGGRAAGSSKAFLATKRSSRLAVVECPCSSSVGVVDAAMADLIRSPAGFPAGCCLCCFFTNNYRITPRIPSTPGLARSEGFCSGSPHTITMMTTTKVEFIDPADARGERDLVLVHSLARTMVYRRNHLPKPSNNASSIDNKGQIRCVCWLTDRDSHGRLIWANHHTVAVDHAGGVHNHGVCGRYNPAPVTGTKVPLHLLLGFRRNHQPPTGKFTTTRVSSNRSRSAASLLAESKCSHDVKNATEGFRKVIVRIYNPLPRPSYSLRPTDLALHPIVMTLPK